MRLFALMFGMIACLITPAAATAAKGRQSCDCYQPWNCCWLCGYAQDWYHKGETLKGPIDAHNPPLNGGDCMTCFDTCAAGKARLVLDHLIYRAIVEEKCYLTEADLKERGYPYYGSSCYDVMRVFWNTSDGDPLTHYQDYVENIAMFVKIALASLEKNILSNLDDAERLAKALEKSKGEFSAEELKQKEDLIKYRRSVAAKYKRHYENVEVLRLASAARIHQLFGELQSYCRALHQNLSTRYSIGLAYNYQGNIEEYIFNTRQIQSTAAGSELNTLHDLVRIDLSKAYLEGGHPELALPLLSEHINQNPGEREAFFWRAQTYFVLGQFDLALSDYEASAAKPEELDPNFLLYQDYQAFYEGWQRGYSRGIAEATMAYHPRLLLDPHGLGRGLWAGTDKVLVTKDLKVAIERYMDELGKVVTTAMAAKMVPELQELTATWKSLSTEMCGEKIGHCIAKYGIGILSSKGLFMLNALYRDVCKANALQTLEMMKRDVELRAIENNAEIFETLRNSRISRIYYVNQGLQAQQAAWVPQLGKRRALKIPSTRFTHNMLHQLLNRSVGKGLAAHSTVPGEETFTEVIDFGEVIGIWIPWNEENRYPTTRGEVHYLKDGTFYVIPLRPNLIAPPSPEILTGA